MMPKYDLREIKGIAAEKKESYESKVFSWNKLKELQGLGLSDTEISQIYNGLTEEWVNSMTKELLSALIDAIQRDDVFETFVVANKIKDSNIKTSVRYLLIPNYVTSVEAKAFYGCPSLQNVFIPNSVTSIGEYAFAHCTSLHSIVIPNSVTWIDAGAFCGCTSLKSIVIPKSVTSIGDHEFSDCSSLKSIVIPNSVTSIENGAFAYCASLKNIVIPNSVASIGDEAFRDCTSLQSIVIPKSVTSIGYSTFADSSLRILNYCGTKEEWKRLDNNNTPYIPFECKVNYNYKGK